MPRRRLRPACAARGRDPRPAGQTPGRRQGAGVPGLAAQRGGTAGPAVGQPACFSLHWPPRDAAADARPGAIVPRQGPFAAWPRPTRAAFALSHTRRPPVSFKTLLYQPEGSIARITLNRPERLNAISAEMPGELHRAVEQANDDDAVHVIVLQGAGRAFCAGYDLKHFAERDGGNAVAQDMPWDPMADYKLMKSFTDDFMALWRSYKPTICRVQGYAAAGGSDIALCCDMVVMAEDARIGYMPARVWGCPTTAMWVYRLGAERAKRMLLTGDLVTGREAKDMGLVLDAVPEAHLDERVDALARRMAGVPKNQLMLQKLMINQALDNMGLANTQMIATLFDGITRHSPEGRWFKEQAERHGFHEAVRLRDSGEPLPEGKRQGGTL
ncbi:MAG: crotonase/enoyl-CoA hydratase family protein [Candidatus Lambdaproteobacteria bacterium]|nr:crotonase/enoyl-CoA hydratase family protein [Candidatus Lambdaproteobacteria bacterium]